MCTNPTERDGQLLTCDVLTRVYSCRIAVLLDALKYLFADIDEDTDTELIVHTMEHINEKYCGNHPGLYDRNQTIEHIVCKVDKTWKYVADQSGAYIRRRYTECVDDCMRTPLWCAARACSIKCLEQILPHAQAHAFMALDRNGVTVLGATVQHSPDYADFKTGQNLRAFALIATRMRELGVSIIPASDYNVCNVVYDVCRWATRLANVSQDHVRQVVDTLSTEDVLAIVQTKSDSICNVLFLTELVKRAFRDRLPREDVLECIVSTRTHIPAIVIDAVIAAHGTTVLNQTVGCTPDATFFANILESCDSTDAIIKCAELMSDDTLLAYSGSNSVILKTIGSCHGASVEKLLAYFHGRLGDAFLRVEGDITTPLVDQLCDCDSETVGVSTVIQYLSLMDDDAFIELDCWNNPCVMHVCEAIANHTNMAARAGTGYVFDREFVEHKLELLRVVASRTPSAYLYEKIGYNKRTVSEVLQPTLDRMELTMADVVPARTKGAVCA